MTELPKYKKRVLEEGQWPRLFIEKGKHSTEHYLVENKERLFELCTALVKQRMEIGYIQKPAEHPYRFDPELAKLTPEAIQAMPESLRATALEAKKRQDHAVKEHAEELQLWAEAQKAAAGDGVAAYLLLDSRKDWEYEYVELKEFDMYPGTKKRRT